MIEFLATVDGVLSMSGLYNFNITTDFGKKVVYVLIDTESVS